MKITVKENREIIMINAKNTQNENDVEVLQLSIPEKYNDFNKKIVFITPDGVVWDLISGDTYTLKRAITQYERVDFYIWLTKGEQDFRSVERTLILNKNHRVDGEVTPAEETEMERVISILEGEITKVDNLNIDANKIGNTTTVTITDKDGNEKSVEILDGKDGKDGKDGDGRDGFSPIITETQTVNGYDISITDKNGTNLISLLNGQNGIDGQDGKDAKINGENILNILAGDNVTIDQEGTDLTINASEYDDTEIKADITTLENENEKIKSILIKSDIIEGQNVTINDTTNFEFEEPPLPKGNSTQNGTPTSENIVAINNVIGNVKVVISNKNLFNQTEFEANFVTGKIRNDSGTEVNDSVSKYSTYTIPVKANQTIYIYGWFQRVYLLDSNKNWVRRTGAINDSATNMSLTPEVDGYIQFQIQNNNYNTNKGQEQIEVNSVKTSYIAHQEQNITFPLSTGQKLMLGDYLADDGIHHVRGQILESGTTITLLDAKNNGAYLCNKKEAGYLNGQTLIFDTAITDALIEYELEEEIIESYTSAQQNAYNQIKQALSYQEQTNITGSSDGANPIFKVQTYLDTKLYIQRVVNANITQTIGGAY